MSNHRYHNYEPAPPSCVAVVPVVAVLLAAIVIYALALSGAMMAG